MILKKLEINKENKGFDELLYKATYRMGWQHILYLTQEIVNSMLKDMEIKILVAAPGSTLDYSAELKENGFQVMNCPSLCKEGGSMTVRGNVASLNACPLQIVLYNQTDVCRLFTPATTSFGEYRNCYEKYGKDYFTHYLDKIECYPQNEVGKS